LGGRSSHSTYIDFLSERGLIGLLLISALFRSMYKRLKSLGQKETVVQPKLEGNIIRYFYLAIAAAIPGYLVGSVFVTSYYFPNMWLIIGLVVSVHRLFKSERNEKIRSDSFVC
jgi:O-antigen ligase